VRATNVALLVLVGGLCWLSYLLVQAPTVMLAGAAGIWLFYVQHQFEDAYWESAASWSYTDAALRGSSYLKLPKVLQFFSGNIGFHHFHHLSGATSFREPTTRTNLPLCSDGLDDRRSSCREAQALRRGQPSDGELRPSTHQISRQARNVGEALDSGREQWPAHPGAREHGCSCPKPRHEALTR
jgi:hypothetical protein